MAQMRPRLTAPVLIGVGAAFDLMLRAMRLKTAEAPQVL